MGIPVNSTSFGKSVKIVRSGEVGTISAFARYSRFKQPQFLIEYTTALGNSAERWFYDDELALS